MSERKGYREAKSYDEVDDEKKKESEVRPVDGRQRAVADAVRNAFRGSVVSGKRGVEEGKKPKKKSMWSRLIDEVFGE